MMSEDDVAPGVEEVPNRMEGDVGADEPVEEVPAEEVPAEVLQADVPTEESIEVPSSRAEEEARRHTLQPSALKKDMSETIGRVERTTEAQTREVEEELRLKLAANDLKLMKSEDTIRYLKELLMVKDKKMEVLQEEVSARRTEPAAYQAHHKQVYSLVDKLQKTEEEVQARMAELAKMKVEMQGNEEKAVLFDTLAMQNAKKDAKIEQVHPRHYNSLLASMYSPVLLLRSVLSRKGEQSARGDASRRSLCTNECSSQDS